MLLLVMAVGCAKTNHGVCEGPNETTEWFFIEETGPPWIGKAYKCVVCDLSVADEDVPAWIEANAGPDFLSENPDLNNYIPCLYTYGWGNKEKTLKTCQKVACEGSFEVNDAVKKTHGAAKHIFGYIDLSDLEAAPVESLTMDEDHVSPQSDPEPWSQPPATNSRLVP